MLSVPPTARLPLRCVSLVFVLNGGMACKSDQPSERRWVACRCEYITDFDHPGHVAVEVCTDQRDPSARAVPCAQGQGVGVVSQCSCASTGTACTNRDSCRLSGIAGSQ
jgi:hypothetical protein